MIALRKSDELEDLQKVVQDAAEAYKPGPKSFVAGKPKRSDGKVVAAMLFPVKLQCAAPRRFVTGLALTVGLLAQLLDPGAVHCGVGRQRARGSSECFYQEK